MNSILMIEKFIHSLERKSVPFREFIQARDEEGKFPKFQVRVNNDEARFIYSREDFAKLKEEDVAEQTSRFQEAIKALTPEEFKQLIDKVNIQPK